MLKAEKTQKPHFLSLIIPAYKQEKTIFRDLKQVKRLMDDISYPYEIIVVVDGNLDRTAQEARKICSTHVKVVGYQQNHGKGYAVRFGMAHAKGSMIAFLDGGMDLNPRPLSNMIRLMEEEHMDIVIGSKLHPKSKVTYPWQRRVLSWGYRSMVRTMFGLSVRDTQVGFKLFRRQVLEDVLPRLLVKRFAFDIEMLAVAYHLGYKRICEAPIQLTFTNWSSITSTNFLKSVFNMSWDTLAVYYRLRILRYYDNKSKRKWKMDPDLNFRVNLP